MSARAYIALIAAALMLASGCSGHARNTARINTISQETQALERETAELSASIKKLSESIDVLERRTDAMHLRYVQPRLNKEGAKRIDSRLDAISRRMGVIEMLGSGVLSIKVLSGDGDISSAKALSGKLANAGYKVKAIDFAPAPNSGPLLVFATDKARPVAEHMMDELGLKAELRPLRWSTVFDIILVTGKGMDNGSRNAGEGGEK